MIPGFYSKLKIKESKVLHLSYRYTINIFNVNSTRVDIEYFLYLFTLLHFITLECCKLLDFPQRGPEVFFGCQEPLTRYAVSGGFGRFLKICLHFNHLTSNSV